VACHILQEKGFEVDHMSELKIIKAPTVNFKSGRKGRKIVAIVNHITAGLMPGTLSWMQNPAAKASTHYLVTKKGEIYQLVNDEDTAYGAGIVNQPDWKLYDGSNPNYYTLHIEHEALTGESLTEPQYQATLNLHRELIKRWSIPADREHIIGHYRIDSINRKNDPGPNFPWERLFRDLQGPVSSQGRVKIMVTRELNGYIIENQTYVWVRELAEIMGREWQWDPNTNSVLILPVTQQVEFTPEVKVVMDNSIIPAVIMEGRTLVPARRFAELLGYRVQWDASRQSVIIQK